jgi:tRNA/rRNA methyltransferase
VIDLAVVLVEPAGPLNVGSVARLCANFSDPALHLALRLVAPRCDHLGPEAQQMAVHGRPLLEAAQLYGDLAQAVADCPVVVATSGRGEGEPQPPLPLEQALGWLVQHSAPSSGGGSGGSGAGGQRAALVFGREDRGLSSDELLQAGALLQIATGPGYRSLNLSHAVALVLHHLHQLLAVERPAIGGAPLLARRDAVEAMLADAEALLLDVGFLYPHTAAARMARLRGLLQRAGLTPEDTALLRGMVRQCRWAAGRGGQTP